MIVSSWVNFLLDFYFGMTNPRKVFYQRSMATVTEILMLQLFVFRILQINANSGLNKITMEDMNCDDSRTVLIIQKIDMLWMYGKSCSVSQVPGLNKAVSFSIFLASSAT